MGEPWVIVPPGLTIEDVKGVWNAEGEHIATFHDADARRRAVACVNACKDWPTETLETWAADPYSPLLTNALRERDERIRKLEGMLKVYASGHHDEAHVGRGAEDYTDCPEQICIDACDALGYREANDGLRMGGRAGLRGVRDRGIGEPGPDGVGGGVRVRQDGGR